jgi:ABC-type glycerol-3-phosphate transport system permease component
MSRVRRVDVKALPIYLSALVICVFSLVPILWGVSTSLKPTAAAYTRTPTWIPNPITLEHYQAVFAGRMPRYFLNTTIIALGSTAVALVVSLLAAYGFSRYKFPGRGTLLWSILFTKILPRVTIVVPLYVTLANLSLLNTYAGLILVYLLVTMPISIWLLKSYFDNIPFEIEEAAVMDGCNPLGVLTRIVIPMALPAIAAVAMYAFILSWNEFLFALVMTTNADVRTVSVGLAFFIDETGVQWGQLMAASILMSIPAVIVFTAAQRLLIAGLSEGAVKG